MVGSGTPWTAPAWPWSARPSCCPPRWWPRWTETPDLDFVAFVESLAERFPVERVEAPAEARRVHSDDDVALLAALTEPIR